MITETEAESARLLEESVPKLRRGDGRNERFTLELYRRTVLELLSRTPLDHEAAREFAKLYFIGRRDLTVAAILLGRNMVPRSTVKLCEGYRPLYTDLAEIAARKCAAVRAARCMLMLNFEHRLDPFAELRNLNLLYTELSGRKVILSDAIRVTDGGAVSLIYPINPEGYDSEKKHKK